MKFDEAISNLAESNPTEDSVAIELLNLLEKRADTIAYLEKTLDIASIMDNIKRRFDLKSKNRIDRLADEL